MLKMKMVGHLGLCSEGLQGLLVLEIDGIGNLEFERVQFTRAGQWIQNEKLVSGIYGMLRV